MARKGQVLWLLAFFWHLGFLGFAWGATYDLGPQGDDEHYTWRHGYSGGIPWAAETEFIAGAPQYWLNQDHPDYAWHFGYSGQSAYFYSNSQEGDHTEPDENNKGTYSVVFDTCNYNPKFELHLLNIPQISSSDAVGHYQVSYSYQGPGIYSILSATLTIIGTNSLDNDTLFRVTAILQESIGNHQNVGYISSMILEYPAVPLPGSFWLLGTGLLGLLCLGFRRR